MAGFNKIEDIIAWQEGVNLSLAVYKIKTNDFGLRDQMRRSAVSIPSNIAEGFERMSLKEFSRFLYIAKGSAGELRTQLYIAFELKMITEVEYLSLNDKCMKISSMISKLIKSFKKM